jgi:hypothetical protein
MIRYEGDKSSNCVKNVIVHLKPDQIYTGAGFRKSHPIDYGELRARPDSKIVDLGDKPYRP